MPMAKTQIDNATVWTTKPTVDGRPIRLVIEPTPNGHWDWTVWQDGRGSACRHGVSPARSTAIGAAEAVAHELALIAARR
jgi:hypothetical protein